METDWEIVLKALDRSAIVAQSASVQTISLDEKLRFTRLRRQIDGIRNECRKLYYEIEDAVEIDALSKLGKEHHRAVLH